MFELKGTLKLDEEAIKAANLADRLDAEDLIALGNHVFEGYEIDKRSRSKWERRTQAAMDLAMQVQKEKSFPWPNCSNIAFPLVTIASLQFHSRAYPAIIDGTQVVKCRVIGDDPTGAATQRANRISTHMSWQKLEEQKEWEEQKDRLLINLPIVGTTFVKSYHDADLGRNIDETVLAQDLILDYWAKSVETCPRKSHIIPFSRNEIHTKVKRKIFRDPSNEGWYGQPAQPTRGVEDQKRDNRMGLTPPVQSDETTPYLGIEQHVDLDLDKDGYAEPYIITIDLASKFVYRIVTGFDRPEDIERTPKGEIISIRRIEYFTKYEFIPSPDGGIYGVGFGVLLGPLNESTNSLINQLVDAGTMSITAGGFLGRGAKLRGGVYTFAPLEWKRVDSTGDDLHKNIFPLPVREPNNVLFQLLSLLISYVERIAGTTDPMVGENPGQNTPAETMRTMVQEGQRVYSAVFKRIWRAMKEEFKKGYILNGIYLPSKKVIGKGQFALREDYLGNPDEVAPSADPNITSDAMRLQQAMALKSFAGTTPGYDIEAVERRVLRALKVDAIEEIYPGIAKTGQKEDVKLTIAKLKNQTEQAWLQSEEQKFTLQLSEEVRVNTAEITKIAAEIENMQATTEGDKADRQVALLQSVMKMMDTRNQHILGVLDIMKKKLEVRRAAIENNAGDVGGLEGTPGDGGAGAGTGAEAAGE